VALVHVMQQARRQVAGFLLQQLTATCDVPAACNEVCHCWRHGERAPPGHQSPAMQPCLWGATEGHRLHTRHSSVCEHVLVVGRSWQADLPIGALRWSLCTRLECNLVGIVSGTLQV
jgi:hypothetical protein